MRKKILKSAFVVSSLICLVGCSFNPNQNKNTEMITEAGQVSQIEISDSDVYVDPASLTTETTEITSENLSTKEPQMNTTECYTITKVSVIGEYYFATLSKKDDIYNIYIKDKDFALALDNMKNDYVFLPTTNKMEDEDVLTAYSQVVSNATETSATAPSTQGLTDTTLYELNSITIYTNSGTVYAKGIKDTEGLSNALGQDVEEPTEESTEGNTEND